MSRILNAAKHGLDGTTHEQTMIGGKVFAGQVVGSLPTGEEKKKSIEWKRFIFLTDGPGGPEFPIDPRWPASPCIRQKLNNKQRLEVKCQQFVISGKIV